ncbi:MAG TPA: hypothetical protein VKB79_17125 [Bryobacteraceae bacterium]|nr:hypothetical protein [Bryobacteraceae bacterium]
MKPRLIALNIILAVGAAAFAWEARVRMHEAELARQARFGKTVKPPAPPAPTPAPKPAAPAAIQYEDVAKKNLFSADRNADIIVDPPKVEAPKPMPPLPVVYGVMTLPSGVKASMADKVGDPTRMLHTGDTVGEFKIIALDAQNITFEWNGKPVPKKIDDLIDRSNHQAAAGGSAQAGPAGPAAPPPTPAGGQPVNQHPTEANLGIELTPSSRACLPGDNSAVGAVVAGYKKVVTTTPFGPVCRWNKE